MKTKYEIITEAREILELPEYATMPQIKENYKRLIKKWHPDKNANDKEIYEENAKKIIEAYKTIIAYCKNYRYSFSKEEVEKYIKDQEWWFKRFGNDPIWGNYQD